MVKLSCKESGLDCDHFVEGKTEDEISKRISEHAINVHNMTKEDIYEGNIPVAFLCHTIGKMTSTDDKQNLD
jgi:predicted small metal-binding protein